MLSIPYVSIMMWIFLYRLATVLKMRLNHEYWCEPECTWQTDCINKTATSERLDSWASRLWRGIELVFKSLHCFTVRPIFRPGRLLEWRVFFFFCFVLFWGGGMLSSNAFTIWCCIPISRPPRVIRRLKRSSCMFMIWDSRHEDLLLYWLSFKHWLGSCHPTPPHPPSQLQKCKWPVWPWPVDLEMVHDTSSPLGLYLCHIWI